MTAALIAHAVAMENAENIRFIAPVLGEAIAQGLAGEGLTSIMNRDFWKQPSTGWQYLRLMHMVVPGTNVPSMVKEVSEDEFR